MKMTIQVLFLFFIVTSAFGQGWVSSGGELFRDAKNPWFVKNTEIVKYCLKVDEDQFSANAKEVSAAVREGFKYWQDEFSRVLPGGNGTFSLGTQTFQERSCSEDVDIRFLFGYRTLTSNEVEQLKNPRRFIGVTVRTSYDLKNLKANGFIFFSSDIGPNAYDNNGTLVEKAWSRPKILRYAILHELGHVFGIPHMGSGLMSEVFLNQILNKKLIDMYEKSPIESFLRPRENIEHCHVGALHMSWFGGAPGNRCIQIEAQNQFVTWKVFGKKDENSSPEEIGEIRGMTMNLFDQRGKSASILELSDEQSVFTFKETAHRSFMMGPMIVDQGISATYIPKSTKKPQPVYISITSSSVTIQAQVSPSKLEPVFIFNSPLSVLLMMPPNF